MKSGLGSINVPEAISQHVLHNGTSLISEAVGEVVKAGKVVVQGSRARLSVRLSTVESQSTKARRVI